MIKAYYMIPLMTSLLPLNGWAKDLDKNDSNKNNARQEQGETSGDLHAFVRKNYAGTRLVTDVKGTQHYIKGTVGEKNGWFHIDSGAISSCITRHGVQFFGLTTRDTNETVIGIGGAEKKRLAKVPAFRVGPHINIGEVELTVYAGKGTQSGILIDGKPVKNCGQVGIDILQPARALIDYKTDRLHYPSTKKAPDIIAKAAELGWVRVPLTKAGQGSTHQVVQVTINGRKGSFVLDTGAQQSVISSKFAKEAGIDSMPSPVKAVGIGDGQSAIRIGSVDKLEIGSFKLQDYPMLVIDLNAINVDQFDGIIGSEFLFASQAIYDIGSASLFLEPKTIPLHESMLMAGKFGISPEKLAKKVSENNVILALAVESFSVLPKVEVTASYGQAYMAARVHAKIVKSFKADKGTDYPEGGEFSFVTVIPRVKGEAAIRDNLMKTLARNPEKIVFLSVGKDGQITPSPASGSIYTDSPLRRRDLQQAINGVDPK
ncbi:MAG: retropepsin-like domain-containing protein [Akkermansiaceae bacterium]|nr:retropepsin-like domain-containing protein [Akkermansiaceae bacterium]